MLLPASYRLLVGLQTIVLAAIALNYGQPILVPLVTAALLTFLLRPAVLWLERHHLPRAIAVGIVGLSILAGFAGIGTVVTRQLHELALHLDEYQGHLRAKIEAVQRTRFRAFDNITALVREVSEASRTKAKLPPAESPEGDAEPKPSNTGEMAALAAGTNVQNAVPVHGKAVTEPPTVRVIPESPGPMELARFVWGSLSHPITTACLICGLPIFILLEFEELRNRVLRLAGQSTLTLTTKTLDEVGRRISRYLLANAIVNGAFGSAVFLGLLAIGVDYAAFWGFLAAAMRFLPYIGTTCAATLAVAMAIIQFPDWTRPGLTVGLFVVLETLTINILEPLTYGKTAGVSTVALMIAAIFWTWLWGPLGLLLSVPMTVALAVIGKQVPQFESLGVLLSDEPALAPHVSFYQRLVAGDVDEAAGVLEQGLQTDSRCVVYDQLVIPALSRTEVDRHQGRLEESERDLVWVQACELLDDNAPPPREPAHSRIRIACCPAHDRADELALEMLQHLAPGECELVMTSATLMASEKIDSLLHSEPDALLISAVGPGSDLHVRYLCKRIRHESPGLRLIVGRWGYTGDRDRLTRALQPRGADYVVTTLAEAVDLLHRIQPFPGSSRLAEDVLLARASTASF